MGPNPLTGLGVVGHQFTRLVGLEHQATGHRQGAAVERYREGHGPARLTLDRVPGQQGAAAHLAQTFDAARGNFQGPARILAITNVPIALDRVIRVRMAVDQRPDVGGDVHQPGVRAVGHGVPVMGAGGPRQHHEILLQAARLGHLNGPAVLVDAGGPGHIGKGIR